MWIESSEFVVKCSVSDVNFLKKLITSLRMRWNISHHTDLFLKVSNGGCCQQSFKIVSSPSLVLTSQYLQVFKKVIISKLICINYNNNKNNNNNNIHFAILVAQQIISRCTQFYIRVNY